MIQSIWLAWWPIKMRQIRLSRYCIIIGERERERVCTFTASNKVVTGSCSWAHGLLKCWRESTRDWTIKPWKRIEGYELWYHLQMSNKMKLSFEKCRKSKYLWVNKENLLACLFHWDIGLHREKGYKFHWQLFWIWFILKIQNARLVVSYLFWYFKSYELCNTSASLQFTYSNFVNI